MTERKKDLLALSAMLGLLIAFFARILFTGKIIRAPDIINEFYWGVVETRQMPLGELLDFGQVKAAWDIYLNSGFTSEGAYAAVHLLAHQKLLFHFLPAPESVAWFIVLNLFVAAVGTYFYCRLIGCSRPASFLAGLIFSVAPENASLINAGHVMKIATICLAPWAFYCFERGFRSRRLIWFLATGLVLAFQFFNAHWQIAYYTCLAIGVYGIMRIAAQSWCERGAGFAGPARLIGLNLAMLAFFLSSVAITIIPVMQWSRDTNRGVQSGSNQGKGGLDREEAMMWSLPSEELGAFVIPGFFGLSRQEGGENPTNISSYYWGRMVFTQTVSYMGLLPWLLVPLPLIFRRDRYTWIAVAGIAGSLLFSMGQYTPVYNLLYDHFPGINRFRVPKMMLFMTVLSLGVLAARGFDLLCAPEVRSTKRFRGYLAGVVALPAVLLVLLGIELIGKTYWIDTFYGVISQPTRYEQGPALVAQRWNNLVVETGIAAGLATLLAAAIGALHRGWLTVKSIPLVLLGLFLIDVGRIDNKFMFLVNVPEHSRGERTPVIEFLSRMSKEYRVLPMDGSDPMQYVSNKIPVMFTSNPVQQRRWQEFLDGFAFNSAMPDIMNVKYIIEAPSRYQEEKAQLGDRYVPVFASPDGRQLVLENRQVLPKAWLVPSVIVVSDPQQQVGMMQNPAFDPRRLALVETPPAIPLPSPALALPVVGSAQVVRYEGEHVSVEVTNAANALLVLGEKYYREWRATDNGSPVEIVPVNHVLRGVYLPAGTHRVEFVFAPWSFRVGSALTYGSFALFAVVLVWELRRKRRRGAG